MNTLIDMIALFYEISFIFSVWMFVPDSAGGRVVETERRRDDGRMLLAASDVDLEMCWTRVDRSSSRKLQRSTEPEYQTITIYLLSPYTRCLLDEHRLPLLFQTEDNR